MFQVCILGMVDIDFWTRQATGRFRLKIIAGETKVCIREQVQRHVEPASLIFTDSHKSYLFLKTIGHIHRSVNHKLRQFSQTELL